MTGQEIEGEFTIDELENALKRMKPGKSEGPEGVAPDLVLQLPKQLKSELLTVRNESWLTSWCPQTWRNAVICPIPKKGKTRKKSRTVDRSR